jgi:hypothetical protein
MTSKNAINQLKNVWSRVGLGDIPKPEETTDTLRLSETPAKRKKSERTAQMNLRIRPDEKHRVSIIALREGVTINEIFSRMLALYEREHGRAELSPAKGAANK